MKNKLINALKSKRGSAIVWAFGVSMVLLIILEGVLLASKSYASRSYYNNSQQQAYMTARSAVEMICKQFTDYNTEDELVAINKMCDELAEVPDQTQTYNLDFGEPMGACELTIKMIGKKRIEVWATAQGDKDPVTVKATLRGGIEPRVDSSYVSSMIYHPETGRPLVQWFVVEYSNIEGAA